MKDNFSTQSEHYARYRPSYPKAFYDYLKTIVPAKQIAWDCGTGNGQVAFKLASFFDAVYATDISDSQIQNALQKSNLVYSIQPAEKTNFPDQYFDLIVVAQAVHWFDFELFYKEVNRTLTKGGVLALIGYGRIQVSEEIDAIISDFYINIIGPFWDKERKYIDELYQTIPFPFQEIISPETDHSFDWTFELLIGYLETWSAVKHFTRQQGYNPLANLLPLLKEQWGYRETRKISFPFLIRVGIK